MRTPPSAGPRRRTAQRHLIERYLTAHRGHITPERLFSRLRQQHPRLGRATLFRTLKLLESQGLLNRFAGPDGRHRLEWSGGRHHDHLICVDCGRVDEFVQPRLENLQLTVARQKKYRLLWHRHELFGLCPRCRS